MLNRAWVCRMTSQSKFTPSMLEVSVFPTHIEKHRSTVSNVMYGKYPLEGKETANTSNTLSRRTKCFIFRFTLNENLLVDNIKEALLLCVNIEKQYPE